MSMMPVRNTNGMKEKREALGPKTTFLSCGSPRFLQSSPQRKSSSKSNTKLTCEKSYPSVCRRAISSLQLLRSIDISASHSALCYQFCRFRIRIDSPRLKLNRIVLVWIGFSPPTLFHFTAGSIQPNLNSPSHVYYLFSIFYRPIYPT